jgi:TPR repeat protein
MKAPQKVALALSTLLIAGTAYAYASRGPTHLVDETVVLGSSFEVTTAGAGSPDYVADLKRRATKGDASALVELAGYYRSGEGLIGQDTALAVKYYQSAANRGSAEAAVELADLYWSELNEPSKALQWSQTAIDRGRGEASNMVGWNYLHGHGVGVSYREAAIWFEKGAEIDDRHAQYALGRMHEEGLGLPVDVEKAYFWCALAARNGDTEAGKAVARLRPQLSSEAVQRLEGAAAEWLKKHP